MIPSENKVQRGKGPCLGSHSELVVEHTPAPTHLVLDLQLGIPQASLAQGSLDALAKPGSTMTRLRALDKLVNVVEPQFLICRIKVLVRSLSEFPEDQRHLSVKVRLLLLNLLRHPPSQLPEVGGGQCGPALYHHGGASGAGAGVRLPDQDTSTMRSVQTEGGGGRAGGCGQSREGPVPWAS